MAQLKEDEWPAEREPTTTESQLPKDPPESVTGHGPRPEPAPRHDDSELSNVTPDQPVD